MGKHALRAAIFADGAGRRTRTTANLVRTAAATLLFGVGALVVSLLADVPLPGIVAPVPLPSNERPVQAGPGGHGSQSPSPASGAMQVSVAPPAGQPPALGTPPGATGAPVGTPVGSVSPSGAGPASPSTPPGTTNSNGPTTSTAAPTHGRARITPPGRTKHP